MKNCKAIRWLFGLMTMISAGAGCAPAYHCYSGCCVNCKYCTPPPLPYTEYKGCVCHSCVAERYLKSEQPKEVNTEEPRDGD